MPNSIHVEDLTSEVVIVTDGTAPELPTGTIGVPAAEVLPGPELIWAAESNPTATGPSADDRPDRSETVAPEPASVDPRSLAERVYTLLRDELIVARERE